MRKKSHISLAMYIVDSLQENELQRHRKAFYLGSILPDCKPSFLTTKHEITGTFDKVSSEIARLSQMDLSEKINMRAYCRDLGQVIHYIADYFTFPHNKHYPGNLKDHCNYEEQLKKSLRTYIKSGEAAKNQEYMRQFVTPEALCTFIQAKHDEYMKRRSDIEMDIHHIVSICSQVVEGILNLLTRRTMVVAA